MLLSIALIMIIGMFLGWVCKKMRLPSLCGMIITGIILGPYMLGVIDESIINISAELRKIALIIILIRAGLNLDISDLKKNGRPAVLMCFLPACFEIIGVVLLAPKILGLSIMESAVVGSVIAAVSPAVIVPRMIAMIENKYGTKKSIPQLILAGAAVDDIFVIVLFTSFTGLAAGGKISVVDFINIPISIILGIILGIGIGLAGKVFFRKFHIRDTVKVILILSVSFILVTLEDKINTPITFSALISIMVIGMTLNIKLTPVAKRLSQKFNKLWVSAEVVLFVLVGAAVNPENAAEFGIFAVILILSVLLFRMLGVYICMIKTPLTMKERIFCMFAYMPKATVQAGIGSIPLAMGLSCGNITLTVAVLSILITAPLGGILIDNSYKKLLSYDG